MKRNLIILILSLIATTSIYAQNTRQEIGKVTDNTMRELETFLDKLSTEDKFSGAVLVTKNGVPIFKKAYGLANKNTNAANNTETKFNLGSMNKMFTSVAVAQLVERGKLSFDDPISKHLLNYPNKSVADKVTIHHLLTHTSGMGDYKNEKFFEQIDQRKTIVDLLPFFANEPLAFEPGAKFQYSNAGFAVLGLIIEKLSGQNYFDYVRENIFKPAGMNNTDSYEKGANIKNLAVGYTRLNSNGQPDLTKQRRENNQTLPAKGSSAGGGYSTVDDLLKFALALQNHKLLSKKIMEIITTGKFDVGGPMGKYAYGFIDKILNGKHIVGHNGGSLGIAANFDMFPELGYTAIILSNYDPPAMMPVIMKVRELIPSSTSSASTESPNQPNERREMRLPTLRFPAGKDFVEVPFEVDSNLMVIPVSVNGSRPLRYVLDTGGQGALLYNSTVADTLNLKISGTVQVRGTGGGGAATQASVVEGITFNIGGIELSDASLVVRRLPSGSGFMASQDGVIGRPVFGNLVVEVDWEKKVVRFYEPAKYNYSGTGAILPLTFDEGGRPYTMAAVAAAGDKSVPVKLVVDTGGSHALSLDVGSNAEIKLPEGAVKTVLGMGASGEVTGYTARVKNFQLGNYLLKDIPTSFPDASAGTAGIAGRQGNLGAGVLRRFKVIYDYSRKRMIVEPNKFFDEPFGTAMQNTTVNSIEVAPAVLQDYVGKYGNKEMSVRDGGLNYQRIGGRAATLRATAKDKFALNADAQITFIRYAKGVVSEMLIEWVDRDKEQLKREIPASNQTINSSPNEQVLSQAEQEVRKLEREWLDAYEKRDAEAMNRIVADDFKLTFPDGRAQTKADILAQLKSEKNSGLPSPKFSTEDVQSRVEGDKVILMGRFIQQMERNGQTRIMQMRYTDTYVKRQGRWQVIASQLMRI